MNVKQLILKHINFNYKHFVNATYSFDSDNDIVCTFKLRVSNDKSIKDWLLENNDDQLKKVVILKEKVNNTDHNNNVVKLRETITKDIYLQPYDPVSIFETNDYSITRIISKNFTYEKRYKIEDLLKEDLGSFFLKERDDIFREEKSKVLLEKIQNLTEQWNAVTSCNDSEYYKLSNLKKNTSRRTVKTKYKAGIPTFTSTLPF